MKDKANIEGNHTMRVPVSGNDSPKYITSFTLADKIPKVAHTRPVSFLFCDSTYSVKSWTDFVIEIAHLVRNGKHGDLLDDVSPSAITFTGRLCISSTPDGMIAPKKIDDTLWIETNFNAKQLVDFAKWLTWWCDVDAHLIKVTYIKKSQLGDANTYADKTTEFCSISKTEDVSSNIEALKFAMLQAFPNGYVFNDASRKILDNATACKCTDAMLQKIKSLMLVRCDGVCLLPEMVADSATYIALRERMRELLENHQAFSLPGLWNEFESRLNNLPYPQRDFRIFLLKTAVPELNARIWGKLDGQICCNGQLDEGDVVALANRQLCDFLRQCGDAVTLSELQAQFPHFNEHFVNLSLSNNNHVIALDIDGVRYWKLLEHLYLPEDFNTFITTKISEIEQAGKTPALQALSNACQEQYGEDFRRDYALEEDDVLKQVIKAACNDDTRIWKGKIFFSMLDGGNTNVTDEFLATQTGIFHEEDFFKYALKNRGLGNRATLICMYLRPKCIRLDKEHWVSKNDFIANSNFSVEIADKLVHELDNLLGQQVFLPLGTITQGCLDDFPELFLYEKRLYWNHYLLASIAARLLTGIKVVNDEPSPYIVTAMQIHVHSDCTSQNVLDYILTQYKEINPHPQSAEQVFEYLKSNQIRMTKTQKLLQTIRSYWEDL